MITHELVAAIKKNLSIDWTDHENVKAKIRATVKRLLRRYGYKPATCETLVVVIMEQAEKASTATGRRRRRVSEGRR